MGSDALVRGRLTDVVPAVGESFHRLADAGAARVEHIVSSDTPDPGEQVQGWDEWVLVIRGAAQLHLAGVQLDLGAGDWVLIPAGTPHRVLSTEVGTHWIVVHGGVAER
jgi:cupin 2 domain-containing protein